MNQLIDRYHRQVKSMGLLRGWGEIMKKKGKREGEKERVNEEEKREFIFYLVVLDHMGK